MDTDNHASTNDPFVDPSIHSSQPDLISGTDLYVSRNARLSLAEDSLVVYGMSVEEVSAGIELTRVQRQRYHATR